MSDTLPQPWRQFPPAAARAVRGVLTDIDDTLTTAGTITPEALQALADLRAAGQPVVANTRRPTGWSAPFAAAWPVVLNVWPAYITEGERGSGFAEVARTLVRARE